MLGRLRAGVAGEDEGLTLVELMVAIVLFGLAASGLAYGLQMATKSTRDNRMRVQAANLAARELEIARNEFNQVDGPKALAATSLVDNPHPLPGGVLGQPLVIDGARFTLQRTVQWLPAGAGQSPCDGGSMVTYPSLAVHVEVTWNQMGLSQPVVSNTVLTPPKGTLNSSLGFIAVKVQGADGRGVGDLPVTLTGPSATQVRDTSPVDGCAVFSVATMGTYTATVAVTGYVTFDGQPSASRTATVTAGSLNQVPLISYDQAATIRTRMVTLGGYPLPSSRPALTFFQSGLPSPYTKKYPSTSDSMVIGGLWPFTSGYSVWAGGCDQADPSKAGGQRPASLPLTAGATVDVDVPLAPVDVTVTDSNGLPVTGVAVRATPKTLTNCLSGETVLSLGTTDSSGALRASLPAGAYELSVPGRSPDGGAWVQTPSIMPTTTPTAVTVDVA